MGRPFKGGHVRTLGGDTEYRLIWKDGKQQLEHRIIMAQLLGRPLRRDEIVHHKDHDGLNNSPDNLELMSQAEHRRQHGGPRKWRISLEEAIRLRESGATLHDIDAAAGVAWGSVRAVFIRRGIATADKRHGATSWDLSRAARRRAEG